MCSLFAGLFPRRTCRFVSQPHPQLTRASILTTNSLQVLHKNLFFPTPDGTVLCHVSTKTLFTLEKPDRWILALSRKVNPILPQKYLTKE